MIKLAWFISFAVLLFFASQASCKLIVDTNQDGGVVCDDNDIQRTMKEAELLFRQASESFASGNEDKAQELYNKSMELFYSIEFYPSDYYGAKEEFEKVFSKLNQSLYTENKEDLTCKRYATFDSPEKNRLFEIYLKLYSQGRLKEETKNALEASGAYRQMILNILKEYDLPEELVYLPVVESLYKNDTLSKARALGLWQIMPKRARALNLQVNIWIDERKDPQKATRAAAQYLKDLYGMFNNWSLAIAAYNRGEYGLERDLKYSKTTNINDVSKQKAIPKETEHFVPKFMAVTILADYAGQYGLEINYDNPIKYDEVTINSVVDLNIAARCAGTDKETIKKLNPALKLWCTPPNYPDFKLKIPAGKAREFLDKISGIKELNPTSGYIKYKVKSDDFLEKIAIKFSTSVSSIEELNGIKRSSSLRIGTVLAIKPGKAYYSKDK